MCPTQDDVTLRWCQPRLELALTAISLPHLAAIEKQVHLLLVADLNQNDKMAFQSTHSPT